MKTLASVKTEIAELASSRESMNDKQYKRAQKRILFLRMVELYLEKMPEDVFISKEISRLEQRINILIDRFDGTQYKDERAAKKKYEKEMNIPHLRLQIKALRFIKN